MTIGFFHPIGTVADANEVEYISALAQTDTKVVRTNGSLTAEDIQHYLLSRYGIIVTEDEVKARIIRGLGGGDEEEDDTIDLMEIVATLLIPTLRKASMKETVPEECIVPREDLIEFVLHMIVHDTFQTLEMPDLTIEAIRKILISYGESDLANNEELLQEMLEAAQSAGGKKNSKLDGNAFLAGLTGDIEQYDPAVETRMSTNREDVFGSDADNHTNKKEDDDEGEIEKGTKDNDDVVELKSTRFMLSALDVTAGTYRSKVLIVLLWTYFILMYYTWINPVVVTITNAWSQICTDLPYGVKWGDEAVGEYVECKVIFSIVVWIIVFVLATIVGTLIVGTGSIGNTDTVRSFLVPLIGSICLLAIYLPPVIIYWDVPSESGNEAMDEYMGTVVMLCVITCVITQLEHVLILLFPKKFEKRKQETGSRRQGSNLKKAAAFKMNRMVENAVELALNKQQDSVVVTHFGQGLMNFAKENRVRWGYGMIETIKNIYSKKIFYEEGIGYSSRLLASNFTQFVVIIAIIFLGNNMLTDISENYTPQKAKEKSTEYVGNLFDQNVSPEQIQALILNISVQFSGLLAETANSDYVREECSKASISSLEDLAKSSCNFTADGYYPSCPNLTSSKDYLCSLGQSYTEAASAIAETAASEINETLSAEASYEPFKGDTGGCCLWGDYVCVPDDNWCHLSRQNCEGSSCAMVAPSKYVAIGSTWSSSAPVESAVDKAAEIFQTAIGGEAEALLNLGLLEASGLDVEALIESSRQNLLIQTEKGVDSIYPSETYMVYTPCVVGIIVAFFTALSLAVTYLPSVTSTVLKLRTGVIPTLRDPEFMRYRSAPDQVTIITGSLFFGCLISSLLVGGLVGVFVMVFLWQATIGVVIGLLGWIVGITVVITLKMLLVLSCRSAFYKAFYRKKPAAVNFVNLALECANFAVSVGFVLLRMIKLTLTSAMYVGRIDTPFLAPGVGQIGPVFLDNYPRVFLKDILSHEAHRHPYIDLLGAIYLMKLRHGENFGRRAGSTWRLIFVYALMPWMNKYRIYETLENQSFVNKKNSSLVNRESTIMNDNKESIKKLMASSLMSSSNTSSESAKIAALEAEIASLKSQLADKAVDC